MLEAAGRVKAETAVELTAGEPEQQARFTWTDETRARIVEAFDPDVPPV